MNEYTRREEVRWTFISALCLVLFIVPAIALLVLAKGKTVPDPKAKFAARTTADHASELRNCLGVAEHLGTELGVFQSQAKAAHLDGAPSAAPTVEAAPEPRRGKKKKEKAPPKEKEPDAAFAWPAAQPSYKLAKALAGCQVPVDAATGGRADAAPAWAAIAKVAAIEAPVEGDTNARVEDAREILKVLSEAPLDKVIAASRDAEADARQKAEQAQKLADTATVVEPIPEGTLPRRAALGIGIFICVLGLLISYFSVRFASVRRLATLVPLREVARSQHPGLHAAGILRLATVQNGGEPGLVIGGALGGLVAAFLFPADADLFVAGVMSGLILGRGMQWLFRTVTASTRWRARAIELADLEKPTIPVVLVLSGVNPGLEAPFIRFFNGLPHEDAANTVEKLAAQAEERILAAADANRVRLQQQQYEQQVQQYQQGQGR